MLLGILSKASATPESRRNFDGRVGDSWHSAMTEAKSPCPSSRNLIVAAWRSFSPEFSSLKGAVERWRERLDRSEKSFAGWPPFDDSALLPFDDLGPLLVNSGMEIYSES